MTTSLLIGVFVAAALFVGYTYAGYPLAIHLAARRRSARTGLTAQPAAPATGWKAGRADDPAGAPAVAIIIVARNEHERIGAKLRSCLASRYPADRLRVLVALDGPDEGTAAAVAALDDPRVQLLTCPVHRGKAATLNDAIASRDEPILVLTDARQRLDQDAVRYLVEALDDPAVGAVSGELVFELDGNDAVGRGLDAYWRYEKFIRRAESIAGSTIGVTGALYALRRSCFRPIPAETILDDVLIPMRAVLAGWRVGFEARAVAHDRPSASMAQEQARKIRTLAGNFQLLRLEPALLDPRRNPAFVAFVSHKVCRLGAPVALAAMLLASAALAPTSSLFAALLGLQVAFYALAFAADRVRALRSNRLARLAATFVAMHRFVVLGFVEFMTNRDAHRWAAAPSPATVAGRADRIDATGHGDRIVYIVSLFPCWSETFIVREIRALIARGVDVRIVSLKAASEPLVQQDAAQLSDRVLYPLPASESAPAALREIAASPLATAVELARISSGLVLRPVELLKSLATWWRTLALAGRVRELGATHLHAHWATYPSTAAQILGARLRLPWSFTGHAHDIFAHDHFLRAKLEQAAFAVTISDYNRRLLARRMPPAALARLQVIHCGVELTQYRFTPHGRTPGLIVAVGRLDPIKGFRHLIDACIQLGYHGHRFECAIVGEGPLRSSLAEAIAAAGLQDRVRLCGALPQEAVREMLCRASVFVLPSVMLSNGDADGIPVAMMEAMACGAPVVSTRVSGIPELIRDEVDGLLASPGDAAGLSERIERLLTTPELGPRLALAARGRVEQGFDVDVEAGRLLECIRSAPRDQPLAEATQRHA